jgi:hypothetical protein
MSTELHTELTAGSRATFRRWVKPSCRRERGPVSLVERGVGVDRRHLAHVADQVEDDVKAAAQSLSAPASHSLCLPACLPACLRRPYIVIRPGTFQTRWLVPSFATGDGKHSPLPWRPDGKVAEQLKDAADDRGRSRASGFSCRRPRRGPTPRRPNLRRPQGYLTQQVRGTR